MLFRNKLKFIFAFICCVTLSSCQQRNKSRIRSDEANSTDAAVTPGFIKTITSRFLVTHKGKKTDIDYPIHMYFTLEVDKDQSSGIFNSKIVSDGGYFAANESEKLLPDTNVKLPSDNKNSNNAVPNEKIIFSNANDSKGMTIEVIWNKESKKWRISKIFYFGHEGQIEEDEINAYEANTGSNNVPINSK